MNKKNIKIYSAILFFILVVVMVGSIELPSTNKEASKITLVIRSKYGSQWELISAGAKAAANEYGAEVSILAPDYDKDSYSQNSLILTADKSNTDAIIIAPIDPDGIQDAVEEVSNKGIPTMNIVSGTVSDTFDSSLMTNYYEVGDLLAIAIEDEIGSDGRLLIITTETDSVNYSETMRGFNDYIDENTTFKVVEIIKSPADEFSAERLATNFLAEFKVEGIVALDETATIGVSRVVEKEKLSIGTVGVNLFQENMNLLDLGYIDQVVNENFFAIGYLSVENMVNELKDNGHVIHRLLAPYLITEDTMFDEAIQQIMYPIN